MPDLPRKFKMNILFHRFLDWICGIRWDQEELPGGITHVKGVKGETEE